MKKILFTLLLFFVFTGVSFAGVEEKACFDLLNDAVKNDSRFTDSDIFVSGDLSEVLFDESAGSYYDFSKYSQFQDATVINPARKNAPGILKKLFHARRNNIGTIVGGNNYLVSQVAGFGRDSNFDFPLESKNGVPFGDSYNFGGGFFKEYVLYTHHLNDASGDLLSCGIVRVIPLDDRSFADISESGYMTNVLQGVKNQAKLGNRKCSSGFEGEYTSEKGKDFYSMKSNVCVQSYDGSDYLKMEVISLAYDNDSTRLNEYVTHPMQVAAMKNNSNHAGGLAGIRDVFLQRLSNETCFSVVHGTSLPARCQSISGIMNIIEYIFPSSYAALDLGGEVLPEVEDGGMMIYGNLPYALYTKIEEIPNETFKEYLLLSIVPEFDDIVQHKQEQEVLLTPYEEVFASCDMSYVQRLDVVTDFLKNFEKDTFSLETLSYSDPKFGDCIIPYPSEENRARVIEGSFLSNQILARQLSGEYEYAPIPEDVEKYAQERQKILDEYNRDLTQLDKSFQDGIISVDELKARKQEIETQANQKIDTLGTEVVDPQEEVTQSPVGESDTQKKGSDKTKYTLIAVFLFVLGLVGILGVIRYKKSGKKS